MLLRSWSIIKAKCYNQIFENAKFHRKNSKFFQIFRHLYQIKILAYINFCKTFFSPKQLR